MTAAIERITPGRGRAGDSISLLGEGFSPTGGQNQVTVGGIAAAVTLDSATQVDVTVPGGISLDEMLEVVITNLDDASTSTWWWWSKDSPANLATSILPVSIPFRDEIDKGLQNSDMQTVEAKFFERIVAALELLPYDLVNAKGAMASMSSTGLRRVDPGVLGETLTSLPGGAVFLARETWSLHWARELAPAVATDFMKAGAIDTDQNPDQGPEEITPKNGWISILSIFCRIAAVPIGRVNRCAIYINGTLEWVEDIIPAGGLGTGESITFYPGLPVSAGDRVAVRIQRTNTGAIWSGRAVAQVV